MFLTQPIKMSHFQFSPVPVSMFCFTSDLIVRVIKLGGPMMISFSNKCCTVIQREPEGKIPSFPADSLTLNGHEAALKRDDTG